MGLDVPFPYPYGSDLHWLWGWSHRIDLMLCREGYIPGSHDWMIFRPSEPADDAMMRYSIDYPAVIADVKERLAATEAAFEKLIDNPTEQTEFVFADRVEVLESRIKKACELIAERESIATNPAATPKPAGELVDRAPIKAGPKIRKLIEAYLDGERNIPRLKQQAQQRTEAATNQAISRLLLGKYDTSWLSKEHKAELKRLTS